MYRLYCLAVVLIISTSCATSGTRLSSDSSRIPKNVDATQFGQNSEDAAIASAMANLRSQAGDYALSSADLLEITVYREEKLGRTIRVSQTGEISLPLIGTLKVSGKSVQEAQQIIAAKLSEYLVNPQVTIFIKEYGNKKIYVMGEVKNPGSFDVPPESKLTVLEAISLAGGFTPIAAKDRTRVIRTDSTGKSETWTVEVGEITSKDNKKKALSLKPNDVVFVPQSFF